MQIGKEKSRNAGRCGFEGETAVTGTANARRALQPGCGTQRRSFVGLWLRPGP